MFCFCEFSYAVVVLDIYSVIETKDIANSDQISDPQNGNSESSECLIWSHTSKKMETKIRPVRHLGQTNTSPYTKEYCT